jgi:hypothetical protein
MALRQVYISHIKHVIENSSFCTTHKSSVSTGFTEQIMSNFRILCYNGSLVIWTLVSLTTAKFKHLIFFRAWGILCRRYITRHGRQRKHCVLYCCANTWCAETYLPRRCLVMAASIRSTIQAFSRHVTILWNRKQWTLFQSEYIICKIVVCIR